MAVKPVIYGQNIMICEEDNKILFSYSGGLIKKVLIKVILAADNSIVVYGEGDGSGEDRSQTTARTEYNLPANSIDVSTYGTQYYIQVKVIEDNDSESLWSDIQYVTIITAPTFEFSNIEEDMTIEQSFIDAQLSYSQAEGELLPEYEFYLYDMNYNLLMSSGVQLDTEVMEYTFSGLENGFYYVRANGFTIHGYEVDTGYVHVHVHYISPEIYSFFYVTNDYQNATITYETNIVLIEYHGEETFEYEDGFIDLTDKTLYYDEGFKIDNNGTFIVKGKDLYKSGVTFFEVKNTENNYHFLITSYIYDDTKIRFKLLANNGMSNYILYSRPTTLLSTDLVTFYIRKKDDAYLFKVYVNGTEVV